MIEGKGRFGSRHDVEGDLEIWAPGSNGDARLRAWIHESEVILPRLQMLVRNDGRGQSVQAPLLRALEDLEHRVARLEEALLRLGAERVRS
jgi:hypothetical protein